MYRIFHIKSFKGQDDFKSLEEILFRRLKRLGNDNPETDMSFKKIPDLILIDGGKGQLSAGMKVLSHLKSSIPIIALAKKMKKYFFPIQKIV